MHARLHRCKHVHLTYTHMQMHTQRGNPGRFISGGLQHSGCLSHFIGHRGRTGMGLFKSNPARPPHTYTHTHRDMHARSQAQTHSQMCMRFLFSGLTDANQSRWRGKEGGIEKARLRQAGGGRKVKKREILSSSEETKRGWSTLTKRCRERERVMQVPQHKYRDIMYMDSWMSGFFCHCWSTHTHTDTNASKHGK